MKYLISPIQLGQLLEANEFERRKEIVNNIINLFYVLETNDKIDLNDHIKINRKRKH